MTTNGKPNRGADRSPIDPQWIVAEVLRRLQALPTGRRNAANANAGEGDGGDKTAVLELTEPVVALATLRGRLQGIESVRVSDRAVVTPAVRDELRAREIALVRGSRQAAAQSTARDGVLTVGVAEAAGSRCAKGWGIAAAHAENLTAALQLLRHRLSAEPAARWLAITERPVALAAICNRQGLSAVAGGEEDAVAEALATIDPRVLTLAPGRAQTPAGRRQAERFFRGDRGSACAEFLALFQGEA